MTAHSAAPAGVILSDVTLDGVTPPDADGATGVGLVVVRQAEAGDRAALTVMLDRCTAQTRYRRFHGAVATFPRRYLTEALSGSPVHHALVACASPAAQAPDDGAGPVPYIVALASCRAVAEGMAELGVLVEDAWQRRGLGTVLLAELAGHARRAGLRALTAQLLTEQAWTAGLLRPYGTCQTGRPSRGTVTVTVRLAPGPDSPDTGVSCRPAALPSASA